MAFHDFHLSPEQMGAVCGVDAATMAFFIFDAETTPGATNSLVFKRMAHSMSAAAPVLLTMIRSETAEGHAQALEEATRIAKLARKDKTISLLEQFQSNPANPSEVMEYLCEFVPPLFLSQILDVSEPELSGMLGHPPWYSEEAEETFVPQTPFTHAASD